MNFSIIGQSVFGKPIEIIKTHAEPSPILIVAALHGDEVEGFILISQIIRELKNLAPADCPKIDILPIANPDGFLMNQRWNANHVDLNRNWPTRNWTATASNPRYPPGPAAESEPETLSLKKHMQTNNYKIVVDLHSYKEAMLLPTLAKSDIFFSNQVLKLHEELKMPLHWEQEGMGYSIAGGYHDWCREQGIHHLVVEIQKGLGQFEINKQYLKPILKYLMVESDRLFKLQQIPLDLGMCKSDFYHQTGY